MKGFLDKDFLLATDSAKKLYHEYACKMPIIDYHCHLSCRDIVEDKKYDNVAEVWLSHDHYKWRLMRNNGVDEYYITGGASDREKWYKWVESLQRAVGNPLYHWCHMELKNYFGYDKPLTMESADEAWDFCNQKLASGLGVRKMIEMSRVEFIGTTDDPIDDLTWHKKLAADNTLKVKVAPTFRPDKALNIDKKDWKQYMSELSRVSGVDIVDLASLQNALSKRMDGFDELGCRSSDHGLDRVPDAEGNLITAQRAFCKAMSGEDVDAHETDAYKSHLLTWCAEQYADRGWVMQLHCNCVRNPNTVAYESIGADSGFDCILPSVDGVALQRLLDRLENKKILPKTILYSLDSNDDAFLEVLAGSFQSSKARGKIQHGAAWWFNDHKQGITRQLSSLASVGVLGNFVGMLTDSRSFLSFARHEYFRRILCDFVGDLVERGEYPCDISYLGKIVEDICYYNAKKYFGIGEEI